MRRPWRAWPRWWRRARSWRGCAPASWARACWRPTARRTASCPPGPPASPASPATRPRTWPTSRPRTSPPSGAPGACCRLLFPTILIKVAPQGHDVSAPSQGCLLKCVAPARRAYFCVCLCIGTHWAIVWRRQGHLNVLGPCRGVEELGAYKSRIEQLGVPEALSPRALSDVTMSWPCTPSKADQRSSPAPGLYRCVMAYLPGSGQNIPQWVS